MPKTLLFIFSSILLFSNCNNTTTEGNSEKFVILDETGYQVKLATVNTDFPSFLDRNTNISKPFINEENKFLYWYHSPLKQIIIIDLQNKQKPKSISLLNETSGKLQSIYGYTIQSPDSIYISTNSPGQISLINSQGQLLNRIEYNATVISNRSNHFALLNSSAWTDVYTINGQIIIPLRTPYIEEKPKTDEWQELSLFVGYEDSCAINLPKLLFTENNLQVSNALTSCKLNNQIYFGFKGDHSLFKVKGCFIEKESEIKSKFATKIYGNMELAGFQLCGSFTYGNLYADPYRNLIYRIAVPPHQDPELNCMERLKSPLEFSIMVFNEDLEIIKEVKVGDKKYSIIHAFVDENGLNLMRSPYHPEYEEDKLVFDALVL